MKLYGPYINNEGRQFVIVIDSKKRRTVSYPKYLVEQMLGRELDPNLETVDHINKDFNDNRIENLRIISRKKHAKEDAKHVKNVEIICVLCGSKAFKKAKVLNHNSKQGKAGPFCSRSCAGKYASGIQHGKIDKLEVQPEFPVEQREYFYIDKTN